MAKLKAPLFSLGASGKLGDALVYFPWKGLNLVRSHVVPANPKTDPQETQRGYVTAVVAAIHTAQGRVNQPLRAGDVTAYAALGGTIKAAMTWFNMVVRQWLKQNVAALKGAIYRFGSASIASGSSTFSVYFTEQGANSITAGVIYYGTSPTALVNTIAATIAADQAFKNVPGLTNGVKYYFQFRPTAHADFVGTRSGIYHATPSA